MRRYETPDDIPDHLQDCCEKWSTGYRFVHPFRFEMFPFESDPDLITELQRAEDAFFATFKCKNWLMTMDMIVGWKHRFRYLNCLIEPKMPKDADGDRAYWELVRHTLRTSTNVHGQEEHLLKALACPRGGKLDGLCGVDYEAFKALREPIVGWRGVNAANEEEAASAVLNGFSWTIDKDRALWFANRQIEVLGKTFVARASFQKSEVEAYFPSEGEGEFIVRPNPERPFEWDTV